MGDYISLHGSYFPNNFGDVLILAIQAEWIRELTDKEIVLPYATQPYRDTIAPSNEKGIEALAKSKKMIYGAGGYLGEPLIGKWKWGFRFFKKHMIPFEYARWKGIDYAVIGPGVGPVTNIFTRKEIVKICKNASILAVRDLESKEYLIKYGLSKEKITVTSDVALTLKKEKLPCIAKEKVNDLFDGISGPKYGVHIGVDFESPTYGDKSKLLVKECIKFFNQNSNITPVLIIDNDNKQQNQAVKYIENNIKRKCIIHKYQNIWETVTLLGELDVVLTNKLHVGIVSYALGTQCISIPYHPKTQRFYRQIKQENLCLPLTSLEKGEALELLNNSLNEDSKNEWKKKRNEMHPKLMNEALRNKDLFDLFLNQ